MYPWLLAGASALILCGLVVSVLCLEDIFGQSST